MQALATSPYHASVVPAAVSATVMKLLTDAGMMIDADRVAAKSCLAQATALLLAERARPQPATATDAANRSGLTLWQINKVKTYVDDNLGTPIRVSALAALCRLSISYFSVAFKRSLGETVHSYLSRRRVARAQELILTTDEPLGRIALDCGFCDQAHLSRMFHRLVGVAPNRWRRESMALPA
ncbi:MAG: AraC family transcriptional regulator [Gammaproteobacteria bacterium]|nr:AraC family transcriptional regulator [Gammaproteobacteria bacterium]